MNFKLIQLLNLLVIGLGVADFATAQARAATRPNIILIITDDLGYGDLGCYGATKISTPNIDRLAAGGVRFTRGYAPSATCTPTRYAILAGEYAWRRPASQTGILAGNDPLAFPPGKALLPQLLQRAGYTTALIGKWHLGVGDGKTPLDFNGEIKPGPIECGFDSAFFIPATVDRVPCVFIDGHSVANLESSDPIRVSYHGAIPGVPTGRTHPGQLKVRADEQHSDTVINGISRIGYMTGGTNALWVDQDIADIITRRAVSFIEANRERPFFLHFGTHDPHVPRVPHPRFVGKSGAGVRGDAIVQLDWSVGEILAALDRLKLADNTLVIFTSDNGPVLFDGYFDGADKDQNGHQPGGGLRGWKYLVYEGGCRVPLIARWPQQIKPRVTEQMFSLVDLFATLGRIVGQNLPKDAAPDSLDLSRVLLEQTEADVRDHVVLHGIGGALALRQGNWKYIPANSKEGPADTGGAPRTDTRFVETKFPAPLLYDLATDPEERTNVISLFPGPAAELARRLDNIRNKTR